MSTKPDTPAAATAFDALVERAARFHERMSPAQERQFRRLATGQAPHTLFITCADSRVVPEMITGTEPGELFVCRNIGNIVPSYGEMLGGVSALVEFACTGLSVGHVVVCGHSDCGAMKGLLARDEKELQRMPTVLSWLRNAEAARSVVEATRPDLDGPGQVQALVEQNVRLQLQHLRTHPAVAARTADGSLKLHGWVYDIETGTVLAVDETGGPAAPLGASAPAI